MGILLFLCITAFLALFAANNEMSTVLASPIAMVMVAIMVVADLYLLRSLVRDWTRPRQ
jgi:membrane protein implicated in regulation of membrane protease activity